MDGSVAGDNISRRSEDGSFGGGSDDWRGGRC